MMCYGSGLFDKVVLRQVLYVLWITIECHSLFHCSASRFDRDVNVLYCQNHPWAPTPRAHVKPYNVKKMMITF